MKKILIYTLIILIFTACQTPKEEPIIEEPIIEEIIEPEVIEPEPEPVVVVEEPVEDVYVATEEEYDRTFEEIEEFVEYLNKIISSGDYVTWKTKLSEGYINKYGDKEFLTKTSENPVLKDYNIRLKTLRDYFTYIVIPARSNVVIDEIQFITEDTIKAYTFKNGNKFVVYSLVKVGVDWIISE